MSELDEYKKAYQREKKSRLLAEQLLNDKTRELYDNVLDLEGTLNKLKTTQTQLIQSEKMASLGQLTAGVAHEINNPISYSYSNLSCLAENITELFKLDKYLCDFLTDSNDIEQLRIGYQQLRKEIDADYLISDTPELITDTVDGLERVKKIVNNLKKVSYQGGENLLPFDVNESIKDCIRVLANELKYTMNVKLDIGEEKQLLGDPSDLNQVFINLFINAIHACKDKDKDKDKSKDKGLLIIKSKIVNEEIVITIQDNGRGIPEESLPRIFDPFYTTKPIGEGTGLGLPVSHGIIEKHNGHIDVESIVDKGTTFIITLPLAVQAKGKDS